MAHKYETHAQDEAGKWHQLPPGWVVRAASRPPFWVDLGKPIGKAPAITQHCDGFYVVPAFDGEINKSSDPGHHFGPFLSFWSAYMFIMEHDQRPSSPQPAPVKAPVNAPPPEAIGYAMARR